MLNFNEPLYIGTELDYVQQAVNNFKICGDGEFTKKCNQWIESKSGASKVLLSTSCTHALEMAALLCDIKEGDEVIMPSFNFVSGANAFSLRGAKIVFVDIRPDTMNIDEDKIEDAITDRTKVILPVHYAGVACEMDKVISLAEKYSLKVVEDAAQGIMSTYKGKALGAIGDFGCYSFHETKNYTMGEGGALLIKNPKDVENAEIIREKGTNRSKFFRGQVDKYTWVAIGSSYLPSDMNAAYLWAQLEKADVVNNRRREIYYYYYENLKEIQSQGKIELPVVPDYCEHNAHMFFLKTAGLEERTAFIAELKKQGILSVFHYVPLHSAAAGKIYGKFHGDDEFTTKESERIVRLPMHYNLSDKDLERVVTAILDFYKDR